MPNQAECQGLKEKVTEYENVISEILDSPSTLSTVVSGPTVINKKNYYRVVSGNSEKLVTFSKLLMFDVNGPSVISVGTEVMVSGESIIGIVPEDLIKKTEATEFSLIGWEEIGGLKSQLDSIKEAVELPLTNAALAKDFGLTPIKGILLYGPPGCGKTLIAKAIASSILKAKNVHPDAFTYIKGAQILSKYVGETEQTIAAMFKRARNYTKKTGNRAIIFIDEAEALLPVRGSRSSSDVESTIVPTFLSEMDGFEEDGPMMLLSTNLPNSIDGAILREERIDLKIGINRPTAEDSEEIFGIHLNHAKCHTPKPKLAKLGVDTIFNSPVCANISGAMIKTVVNGAARKALSRITKNSKAKKGIIELDIIESINTLKH